MTSEPATSEAATSDPADLSFYTPLDDLRPDQRLSSYWEVERTCRGPEPIPGWLVTGPGAIDTDLGVLKTGKEAVCHIVERATPDGSACLLASKRYLDPDHRTFHRSAAYTEGRRVRNTRDARAMAKNTDRGRVVAASQWAFAEWAALTRLWSAGLPVPYPVQICGTEVLMELITHEGEAAPRLVQARPSPELLEAWFGQLREAMVTMARQGWAHGDLSPYNILAAGDRIVIIDLPQIVDVIANPHGLDMLHRDCVNVCTWFQRRGLEVDEEELFGDLLAHVL